MPPRTVSRNSTTVTSAPSRRQTEPSSSPITPAPTTTRCPGTLSRSSAPVEETIVFSSNSSSTPGMPATSDPVAMTMFFASISLVLPSSSATETLPSPSTVPVPRSTSTLFFFIRKATPSTLDFTVASLCAIIAGRSSFGLPTLTPSFGNVASVSWNISDACSSAFDGMQPMLRQVPPSVGRFSTIAVLRPSCAHLIAQT